MNIFSRSWRRVTSRLQPFTFLDGRHTHTHTKHGLYISIFLKQKIAGQLPNFHVVKMYFLSINPLLLISVFHLGCSWPFYMAVLVIPHSPEFPEAWWHSWSQALAGLCLPPPISCWHLHLPIRINWGRVLQCLSANSFGNLN